MSLETNTSTNSLEGDEPLLPETKRELEAFWARELNLEKSRGLFGKISNKKRKEIAELLGSKEKSKELLRGNEEYKRRKIYDQVIDARKGLYPYIEPKNVKDKTKIQIQYVDPAGSTNPRTLQSLLRDPDSKEAQVIAWLYNQAPEARRSELSPVFDTVQKSHIEDAQHLLKMKELMNTLQNEKSYRELGTEGAISSPSGTPPVRTISGGSGLLLKIQEQIVKNMNDAEAERVKTRGTPGIYDDKVSALQEKLESAKEKKEELSSKLKEVSDTFSQLSSRPTAWTAAEIQKMSEEFQKNTIEANPTFTGNNVTLERRTRTMAEWVKDAGLQGTADSLIASNRRVGSGLPESAVVLDALNRKIFAPNLTGMPKDDREKFYGQMKEILLSDATENSNSNVARPFAETAQSAQSTAQHGRLYRFASWTTKPVRKAWNSAKWALSTRPGQWVSQPFRSAGSAVWSFIDPHENTEDLKKVIKSPVTVTKFAASQTGNAVTGAVKGFTGGDLKGAGKVTGVPGRFTRWLFEDVSKK